MSLNTSVIVERIILAYKTDCKMWIALNYYLWIQRYYSDGHLCNLLTEQKMAHGLKDLLMGVISYS